MKNRKDRRKDMAAFRVARKARLAQEKRDATPAWQTTLARARG